MSSNDSTNDITNLLKVASTVGQLFNHAGNGNANPQHFMPHNSMGMMLQPGANSMMQQPMMMQQMQPQQMQPHMIAIPIEVLTCWAPRVAWCRPSELVES